MNNKLQVTAALLIVAFVSLCFVYTRKLQPAFEPPTGNPKIDKLKLPANFKAEHLYSPSENNNGSWVAMCFDDKGRMIASDQYGYLYRNTIKPVGADTTGGMMQVEKLEIKTGETNSFEKIKMGFAHGLLYAFNSLYVMVNHNPDSAMNKTSGLYRLQDTDNDDQYDKITLLKTLVTPGGEHGPHSIILSPDKQSIYVIAGNHTDAPPMNAYRLPKTWQEDNLFPLIKDPNGHANDRYAPGGWIAKVNPAGDDWELVSAGYRNPFDIAFNEDGELFTYDADMEWDFGMPWYRPTRINHATSGSEYGWRTGNSKWSPAYPDNLPAVLNIGQGSPTNLINAHNARFPDKYRRSLLAFDWSFGIIYAIQLVPDGASYKATAEEFISGSPLPLTDGIVGPDGALYFLTGGRRLESDLYRVYYGENKAPIEPLLSKSSPANVEARNLRKQLEQFHAGPNPNAIAVAWPFLKHQDRFIRYAARIAVEHQPVSEWQEKALNEEDPQILTQAMIALARAGAPSTGARIFDALRRINFRTLPQAQQVDVVRAFELALLRTGKPDAAQSARLNAYLNPLYPASSNELNRSLCKVLVYIDAPQVVPKTIALMRSAKDDKEDQKTFSNSQDLVFRNPQYGLDIAGMLAKTPPAQQIYYATALSEAKKGWTPALQNQYFGWFKSAFGYKGGNSYVGFIDKARKTALANVPKTRFEYFNTLSGNSMLTASGTRLAPVGGPKGPGRRWKVEEALAVVEDNSTQPDFTQGKMLFAATQCLSCHSMRGEGGASGPDLTQLGTRFSKKDILEAIIEPSKTISDQYAGTTFFLNDGTSVIGRLKNEENGNYYVSQNPFDPQQIRVIPKSNVQRTMMSPVSIMYPGLINGLNPAELSNLVAYLTSTGNKQHEMYKATSKK